MKIYVDQIPSRCADCLFLGTINQSFNSYTGCNLTKVKITYEIGTMMRLANCPLIKLKGEYNY